VAEYACENSFTGIWIRTPFTPAAHWIGELFMARVYLIAINKKPKRALTNMIGGNSTDNLYTSYPKQQNLYWDMREEGESRFDTDSSYHYTDFEILLKIITEDASMQV
jgi:hypothetical protein